MAKPLKMLTNGDFSQWDESTDDFTANSITGSIAGSNIDSGTIAKERYDSGMVDPTLSFADGVLGIELTNANTWGSTQTCSGFDGEKLVVKATATDDSNANVKIFNIKNSADSSVASIDELGDMVVNDLTVNGAETIVGTVLAQSHFSVSGNTTLGDTTGDIITFIGKMNSTIDMDGNNIITGAGTVDGRDVSVDGTALDTAVTDITNLEAAAGSTTGLAGLSYNEDNYVDSGTDALDIAIGKLDAQIKDNFDSIGSGGTDLSSIIGAVGASGLALMDYTSDNYVTSGTDAADTAIGLLDAQLFTTTGASTTNAGNITNLQTEVDAIETSMGAIVNSSGVYQAHSGSNYIDGNADLTTDLLDLDAQVFANAASATSHADVTLNNLGTTDINASLLVDTADTYALGSATKGWNKIWAKEIDTANSDNLRLGSTSLTDFYIGGNNKYRMDLTKFGPNGTGLDLGTSSSYWKDIYTSAIKAGTAGTLTVGFSTNVNVTGTNTSINGTSLLLKQSNTTKLTVGASDLSATVSILPSTSGTLDLGTAALVWKDVYTDSLKNAASTVTMVDLVNLTDGTNADALHSHTGAAANVTDLEAAVGSDSGLAGLDYSSNNYVTDATSLETAIGALDTQIFANEASASGHLNLSGGTMTGDLTMGANKVTSSYTPDSANVLTNKAYVDSLTSGLRWIDPVFYIDLVADDYGTGTHLKDLQTPANTTVDIEDSDMVIADHAVSTFTAVGVAGASTSVVNPTPGTVLRYEDDAANGFVNPTWENLGHISDTVAFPANSRWGISIDSDVAPTGTFDSKRGFVMSLTDNGSAAGYTATWATATELVSAGAGASESTTVTSPAGGTFTSTGAGDYFTFETEKIEYYVWYNVTDGSNTDPDPFLDESKTGVQVDITTAYTADQVRSFTSSAVGALTGVTASNPSGADFDLTIDASAAVQNAVDINSGVTFAIITEGEYATGPQDTYSFLVNNENSQNAFRQFTYSNDLGRWIVIGATASIVDGDALSFSGNILNVNTDASTIEVASDALQLKDGGITNAKVNFSAAIAESKLSLTFGTSALNTSIGNNLTEINAIETSMGAMMNSSGVYVAHLGTNYLTGNSDVAEDLVDLDAQVFANAASATSHADVTLSNLGTTAIDAHLTPDGSWNLGTSSAAWATTYTESIRNFGDATVIDVDNLVDKSDTESIAGAWDFTNIDLNSLFKINGTPVGAAVSATNLDTLTDGSNADALHSHAAADSTDLKLAFTASGTVNDGAPVYVLATSDNTVAEGNASAIGTARLIGIAEAEVADAASGNITTAGFATIATDRIIGAAFTRGAPVYLSETTGKLTSDVTGFSTGSRIYQVGVATTTTSMVIDLKQGVTVA